MSVMNFYSSSKPNVFRLDYVPYKHGGKIGVWRPVAKPPPIREAQVKDLHDGTLRPGMTYLFRPFTDKNMYREWELPHGMEYHDFVTLIKRHHVYIIEGSNPRP